jgi:putative hydrolase of the HAD superfamily
LPTIIMLRQQGKTVGLISNNDRAVEPICDELLLTPHLEVALSSIVFGCEKPDPRIFIEALRLANVEAPNAVHVGDQYHSDARGAIAAGVHPVLIDRYGLLPDQPGCTRIANLWQLPDLLCALR